MFKCVWGPNHGIEVLVADTCKGGIHHLRRLAEDSETRCVLVTDYELGDGRTGSELIQLCQTLFGAERSFEVLQSGSPLSELLEDPVVRGLPPTSLLAKPVRLAQFEELLPSMAAVWGLSLEG
jgi:hypothetical protein